MCGMAPPMVVSRVWMRTSFWLFHHLRRGERCCSRDTQSAPLLPERPCLALKSFLKLMSSAAFHETMSHLYRWRFPGAWGVPWSAGFTRCASSTNPSPTPGAASSPPPAVMRSQQPNKISWVSGEDCKSNAIPIKISVRLLFRNFIF